VRPHIKRGMMICQCGSMNGQREISPGGPIPDSLQDLRGVRWPAACPEARFQKHLDTYRVEILALVETRFYLLRRGYWI
jgi:hypothetical protein